MNLFQRLSMIAFHPLKRESFACPPIWACPPKLACPPILACLLFTDTRGTYTRYAAIILPIAQLTLLSIFWLTYFDLIAIFGFTLITFLTLVQILLSCWLGRSSTGSTGSTDFLQQDDHQKIKNRFHWSHFLFF